MTDYNLDHAVGAELIAAQIHGGDDGVRWTADNLDTPDETASLPVLPADWLTGLAMPTTPWVRALGEQTEPAGAPGYTRRFPFLGRPRKPGRHRRP